MNNEIGQVITKGIESPYSFTPAVVVDGRCYLRLVVAFKGDRDNAAGGVTTTRFLSPAAAPGRADKLVQTTASKRLMGKSAISCTGHRVCGDRIARAA